MRKPAFYENIHRASNHYPYLDFEMENINYISHFHEEIEFVYVKTGNVIVNIDSALYNLNCGEIAMILPGEIHSLSSNEDNKIFIFKIMVPPTKEKINFSLIRLKEKIITNENKLHPLLTDIILQVENEFKNKKQGYEIAINMKMLNLLLLIIRNTEFDHITIDEKKRLQNRLLFLKSVDEFVEKNYMDEISLSQVADHCKYSLYYFSHYFKEITNASFLEYLSLYRLEKASTLMAMTDGTMTSIAFSCGFFNIRSFNRMFKKHYHMTPTEYRKKLLR